MGLFFCTMPSVKLTAAFLVVAALSGRPTAACECARPAVEVSVGGGSIAPTNAHVWVSWEKGVDVDAATIAVRPAQRGKPAAAVAADTRATTAGDTSWVELAPKQALTAKTRYEVVLASAGGKVAVVAEFTTGAAADTTKPTWKGISKAVWVQEARVGGTCATGDAYAMLTVSGAADDVAAAADLRYAVWTAGADGKIDTSVAPQAWARTWGDAVLLGHPSECRAANFTFAFAVGAKQLKLAVAVVDGAGNASEPVEVTVDLTKPLKQRS